MELCDYCYYSVFICDHSSCKSAIGTRTQSVDHHNCHHHENAIDNSTAFEFCLGGKVVNKTENAAYVEEINEIHQMYLFECKRCNNLFESMKNIEKHLTVERCIGVEQQPRFSVKRLYRCREDNIIRSFSGLTKHYQAKHPGVQCTPANLLMPECYCGLCDYLYKGANDLNLHYNQKHGSGGDIYNDELYSLMALNMDQIDVNQCKYKSRCCNMNTEPDQLDSMIKREIRIEINFFKNMKV